MSSDKLRVAEIFTSLQGEGGWLGIPSTFVRISGCNLRCKWCDTPYASWNPEGPTLAISEIVADVESRQVNHVVVTGGEPMLFDAVERLCRELKRAGHTITIETAGTVFRDLPCDLMSISPKLSNSTPGPEAGVGWTERHEQTRSNPEALACLIRTYPYQLKFVVNPEDGLNDFEEIDALLGALPAVPPSRVVLMAEGIDPETQLRRQRMLVPICLARGWRLTPRMHIDLFGNTKGT
jgi:7-carboxy-7-deazaguanine synthase